MRYRWWLALFVWLLAPAPARAWEIAGFDTRVEVHEDATATVTETILANFQDESRHGIYRDIPVHYQDRIGQHVLLRLRIREVTDRLGQPWRYQLESAGRYRRIRIGDPDATVTGFQTYRLVYEVQRGAVRFFPDHDECYWNLTGNEWAVPMRRVRAEVSLPTGASEVRAMGFLGGYGSTDQLRDAELRQTDGRIILEPARSLQSYEGLTAAIAWAKGAVVPPPWHRVIGWWLEDNWVYGIPLLALACMGWLWQTRGRDPRPAGTQVVEYEPPDGLTPAEMGGLMDQRVNLRDLTSTIVDLAVRGFLRIEPESHLMKTDYRLVSLKGLADAMQLKPHERTFLQRLFSANWKPGETVKLSDLEEKFYEHLPGLSEHVYVSLIQAGYLEGHPKHIRLGYGVVGLFGGAGLMVILKSTQPWHQLPDAPLFVAPFLSGAIIILIGLAMPRRTLKGARTTDRIFGFREFLRRTDQDRIRRINDPSLFERCLPYALAFGVAQRWTKAFEGIATHPPAWYGGPRDTFSPTRLGRDLDHATASMSSALSSHPSSSSSGTGGGGFSGGGGGGGGGGAW